MSSSWFFPFAPDLERKFCKLKTQNCSYLHEKARDQRLPDVDVVLRRLEGIAPQRDSQPRRHARELPPHRVGALQSAKVEEVVVAPLRRLAGLLERVEHVEQRQVVPVRVREPLPGSVCLPRRLSRPEEDLRHREHRDDRDDLVGTAERRRGDDGFRQLRVERQLGHHGPHGRELPLVVEGSQVVEELEGAHQRLGRGRVHEIKVNLR